MPKIKLKTTLTFIAGITTMAPCLLHAEVLRTSIANQAAFNRTTVLDLEQSKKQRQAEYYSKKLGVYVGATDALPAEQEQEHTEIDTYAGIANNVGDFGFNLGIKAYNQSLYSERKLNEFFVGGQYKLVSLGYAENDEGKYTQLNIHQEVLPRMNVEFHVGNTMREEGESFRDYRINAKKAYQGLLFNASLIKREAASLYHEDGTEFSVGVSKQISLF